MKLSCMLSIMMSLFMFMMKFASDAVVHEVDAHVVVTHDVT